MSKLTIVIEKVLDPAEEVEGLKVPFYTVYRDWGSKYPYLSFCCQTEPEAWEYLASLCMLRSKQPPII